MKHIKKIITLIVAVFFVTSCSKEQHFISDKLQRADVQRDLQEKMAAMPDGGLFAVFNEDLAGKEREALEFLYAYMPLCDVTDYGGDYFRANINASFRAKEEMPWGVQVPEREFNHFVVPVRINNENLDDSRFVFYEELKDRVKNLSMSDAVLEVNHWCHEKANYKGSDSRTSSPLATVKTSWGRCGEESTFLVAALRSVCIPARQVYTPRWAHCDDNHAWVEAWVDGEWHFLGACEPEPVLDLGWFNAPASRCLLLHTRVFGRYYGPEEVIERTSNHTEINVVYNYAETAKLNVKVADDEGDAVAGAKVDFKIYNYAEFCTVASKTTDEKGETWMTAGLGTMMIYASKDGKYGYEVVKIGDVDDVTITIKQAENVDYEEAFDIVPPTEKARIPEVSKEMRDENNRRGVYEDSIRNAYVAKCVEAQNEGDYDKEIMSKTWGNYQTIKNFVDYSRTFGGERYAWDLLKVISDKDLRDVSLDVLKDNFSQRSLIADNCGLTDEMFNAYVYNPRVSNEMLGAYKQQLMYQLSGAADLPEGAVAELVSMNYYRANPQLIVDWVKNNIEVRDDLNVRSIPMLPTGVLKSRVADSHSRDIFFVAMARSAGIPSRIDPVTGKVQYFENQWVDVDFEAKEEQPTAEKGTLVIEYSPTQNMPDPRYYSHFTIKKFNGNTFDLLAYDDKDPGMDVGLLYSQLMADGGIELDAGYYVMISGTRLADGSVLNHNVFFNIEGGKTTTVGLVMREPVDGVQIIGNFNSENRFMPVDSQEDRSLLQIAGRSFYVLGILDGGSEPTTHAMQDISILKDEFEEWGGSMIFVFQNEESLKNFKMKNFNDLPSNITFGIDDGTMLSEAVSNMKLQNRSLPIFLIANSNNEVVFVLQGYTIGLGEQIVKVLHRIP
ncbi:MAG: transglutaminase domain-containing protein [Bacteroidales bacterium]|nr:transglutaminase domain-containing protein [Bacteroidales bacterium]